MPDQDGQSLIGHVTTELLQGGAWPVVVVLGPESERHCQEIGQQVVSAGGRPLYVSPAPAEMLQSIQAGIRFLLDFLPSESDFQPTHILFTPADLPAMSREFVCRQIALSRTRTEDLVRGMTPQGRGIHPVGINWRILKHIIDLESENGLKSLWQDDRLTQHNWEWHGTHIFRDLDNPHDWEKFQDQS